MHTLYLPNSSSELLRVEADKIVYVEADSNYCSMYLKGGIEQNLWFNMKHFTSLIEEQMNDDFPFFVSVGRSLIINLKLVYRINPKKGELILYGEGCTSPVCLHASVAALDNLWATIRQVEQIQRIG